MIVNSIANTALFVFVRAQLLSLDTTYYIQNIITIAEKLIKTKFIKLLIVKQ